MDTLQKILFVAMGIFLLGACVSAAAREMFSIPEYANTALEKVFQKPMNYPRDLW
jgi:hypothetical protein